MPPPAAPSRQDESQAFRRRHSQRMDAQVARVNLVLHGTPADEPFLAQIIIGILEASRQHRLEILVTPGGVAERDPQAVGLLIGGDKTQADMDLVRATGLPAVCIGLGSHQPDDVPLVANDNSSGIGAAVRHLHQRYHRNIAFIGGPDANFVWRERREAWRSTLTTLGLGTELDFTVAENKPELVTPACLNWWANRRHPTAVIAASDQIAAGVYAAAEQLGLRIPHDLSIIGFDDLEFAARLTPPLTTVLSTKQGMGVAAVEMLARLVAGEKVESRRLPVRLIERASVATPHSSHS